MDDPTEAVVVGHTDFGEVDRIVRLLTAHHGRVDVFVRGARSSKRRFGGALELGSRILATWRRGRGDTASLSSADMVATPRRARESYARLVLLAWGCEVLMVLAGPGHAGPLAGERDKGFRLLVAWLDRLEADPEPDFRDRLALEAKALTFAGTAPALVRCAQCGLPLAGMVRFDVEAGGGVHPTCGGGKLVDASVLASLDALRRTPLAAAHTIAADRTQRWLLADFIEHDARTGLKSRALLAGLEDV